MSVAQHCVSSYCETIADCGSGCNVCAADGVCSQDMSPLPSQSQLQQPEVEYFNGLNQVFNVAKPAQNTTTIRYLGNFKDAKACGEACAAHKPERCWSFTYHGAGLGAFARQCFGIVAPRWSPTPDGSQVTSGVLQWPCRNDEDCSLNGKCDSGTGKCSCRKAWGGRRCERLQLLPARVSYDLRFTK